MKRVLRVLLILGILSGSIFGTEECLGQNGSSGFVIEYDVKTDGEAMSDGISPEMLSMMPNKMTMYIGSKMSCLEMNSAYMTQKTIVNSSTGEFTTVMDMMGMKLAVVAKNSDLPKIEGLKTEETGKTKTIADYVCKEIKISYEGNTMSVYVTKEIGFKGIYNDNPLYAGIDGCMLEYEVKTAGLEITVTANKVEKRSINKAVFEIPADCKKMTFEEAKAFMGLGL